MQRVCDNRKIGVVNFTCLKREDGLLWIIKFALTSCLIRGLPAWVRPYSTKGKREDLVLLSKANEGQTVTLIGGQASCVMTSPAKSQDKVCLMLMIEAQTSVICPTLKRNKIRSLF